MEHVAEPLDLRIFSPRQQPSQPARMETRVHHPVLAAGEDAHGQAAGRVEHGGPGEAGDGFQRVLALRLHVARLQHELERELGAHPLWNFLGPEHDPRQGRRDESVEQGRSRAGDQVSGEGDGPRPEQQMLQTRLGKGDGRQQHQSRDRLRMAKRPGQGDGAPEGMSDHHRPLEAQAARGFVQGVRLPPDRALQPAPAASPVAWPIDRGHPELRRQSIVGTDQHVLEHRERAVDEQDVRSRAAPGGVQITSVAEREVVAARRGVIHAGQTPRRDFGWLRRLRLAIGRAF